MYIYNGPSGVPHKICIMCRAFFSIGVYLSDDHSMWLPVPYDVRDVVTNKCTRVHVYTTTTASDASSTQTDRNAEETEATQAQVQDVPPSPLTLSSMTKGK